MLIDRSIFFATSPLQALTCTCDCPLNDKTGGTVLGSGQTANQWSGTELQGMEELRVRPRRGEQVRRDLQGDQVLAREEQERIHCLEVPV